MMMMIETCPNFSLMVVPLNRTEFDRVEFGQILFNSLLIIVLNQAEYQTLLSSFAYNSIEPSRI
jgi:hypothetical protein